MSATIREHSNVNTSGSLQLLYGGKFLNGANFRIFCMKPGDTKIKATKF